MILAVLGEAACRRVEVAAIERLMELLGDAPIGLDSVQGSPFEAGWDRSLLFSESEGAEHRSTSLV